MIKRQLTAMKKIDASSTVKPNIDRIVEKIDEISTLPPVLHRVLSLTADPNARADQLQNILQTDPALTAKILKVANSAYYGATQQVTSIRHAIIFLGFSTVRNLAMATSICDMFKSAEVINAYSREELWKHSIIVALFAQSISQRSGAGIGADIFTAGILHDIGIIMEDQYFHDDFTVIIQDELLAAGGLTSAEKSCFGFDHAELGSRVTHRWRIPEEIVQVIKYHHKPLQAPESYRRSACIAFLADVICSAKKVGYAPQKNAEKADIAGAMEILKFSKEDVVVAVQELPRLLEKARQFFISA